MNNLERYRPTEITRIVIKRVVPKYLWALIAAETLIILFLMYLK